MTTRFAALYSECINAQTDMTPAAEIKISIFIKLDQPSALSASLPPMKANVALAAKPKASIKHTKVAL